MIVYNYHPTTGEYLGESEARESPLEPGVYLIPAYATETAPLPPGTNQIVVWSDGTWVLQDIPEVVEPETPVPTKDEKIAALDAEYDALFAENDMAYIAAVRNSDTDLQTELNTEKTTLQTEYATKLEAINNGN